ncbi:hypothetical protein JOC86_000660 [Bacillus pakistanensis]|uniref:Competence protein ComK n=1 Tax=Rossellomorea pakistanensis TaxID=992288 RepID=A0ABS2N8G3_9BACI|nr:competence protein ComK [Bacillus pakistanensis]MBM7584123.1 hypothetical protein [Bacillus pakistanensis]
MFNERMALKIRFEQLHDAEERILREFREERNSILKRLRELDEAPTFREIHTTSEPTPITHTIHTGRGRKSPRAQEMRKVAVNILQSLNEPIRGTDLQRQIEERTGYKIANMTTFMRALERQNHHVIKANRGLYTYQS